MSQTLDQIISDAKETLRDEYDLNEVDPHDAIAEIADGAVPIYTGDLLQLAADNIALATDEPEFGAAFDGSPTPANIIAANVYEAVSNALHEEIS